MRFPKPLPTTLLAFLAAIAGPHAAPAPAPPTDTASGAAAGAATATPRESDFITRIRRLTYGEDVRREVPLG